MQYESYKDRISRFHDRVMTALKTADFLDFVNTPTMKLFEKLATNVKAIHLLTPHDSNSKSNINTVYLISFFLIPKSLKVDEQSGKDFAENLSWNFQVDKTHIDYRLSDFDLEPRELYLESNDKKIFVYLDLKSANFNSWKLLNPNLVLNCNSWEELCGK